jgi:hypothetical protein
MVVSNQSIYIHVFERIHLNESTTLLHFSSSTTHVCSSFHSSHLLISILSIDQLKVKVKVEVVQSIDPV